MKSIGIALISLIPILIGFFQAGELQKNEKRKWALIEFLEEMQFQIQNFNRSQSEFYVNFENKILESDGFLLHLRREVKKEPWGALERVMHDFLERTSFQARSKTALEGLTKRFGMQAKSAQIEDLTQTIFCLKEEAKNDSVANQNRAKICKITGFTIGIGIFILLI